MTCENCIHLIYPTIVGYSCRKVRRFGTDLPLHDGGSCKKWKLTNRKDDVNGFVPVDFKPGITYGNKKIGFYYTE